MIQKIVIVGAGQAGLAAVAKLRQEGFNGSITLLGDEGFRTNSIDIRKFED